MALTSTRQRQEIGERLREERERLGYSEQQISQLLGIPIDAYIRFEEGGTFTDHGYIVNNQDRFIEQYNGDREEIPDEYRVFTSTDEQELDEPADLPIPEKPSIRKQLAENKEKCASVTQKNEKIKNNDLEV